MIEDMEESVLSLGSCHPFLNIIHYQDIDCLIEINEVVGRIMQYGVGVLSVSYTHLDVYKRQ